ncbi:thiol:disulfide interchange protein DsbA [Thiogranum longum]|uniref:Thiol:disulfide interchange protein n=1 Tax=Thiogranum longum TaxID=1537524 RepID=A0A4R1HIC2_9GAMM|nr:thiol:disulfide interchange protein DsbA/DsbL [Thiogranum longum]TCK16952.1 thiol:disulfide interchange protein DsbA [Thiogranum longum]
MKNILRLVTLMLFAPLAFGAWKEGVNYEKLSAPQPTETAGKIEVRELFWYACPHCYQLEPELHAWLEKKPADVEFVRMPAVLGPNWELLARAYYTAEILGVLDKVHEPIFDRLHKQRKRIRTPEDVKAIFAENGVSAKDFDNAFASFAVITKTNRSKRVREMYGVTGVPTLIINGKYRTSATMAGGNRQMLEVVDYLVEQERKAAGGNAAVK